MSDCPLLYLVLGTPGSGRREVLADLIEGGLNADDRPAVLLAESEAPNEFDARLPALARWKWTGEFIEAALPSEATHVFLILDSRGNLIDQLEVAKAWIEAQGAELARVISVIDCELASEHPPLLAWFEACVHFSDIVLLNRRDKVGNKWLSDFQMHFKKQFIPCLFELVRAGRVKNPALILEPQARRLSHAFDEEQDLIFTDSEGDEIDEDEETEDDEEEIEAVPEEDLYFARRAGGRRAKELPDIRKYLPPV